MAKMYAVEITRLETHIMWVRADSEEQVREALTEGRLPELYDGLPEWHETEYSLDRVEVDDDWREGDIDLDLSTIPECPHCGEPLEKIERIALFQRQEVNVLKWDAHEEGDQAWVDPEPYGPSDEGQEHVFVDRPYAVCTKCRGRLDLEIGVDEWERITPRKGNG